jgi:hypothetical protein
VILQEFQFSSNILGFIFENDLITFVAVRRKGRDTFGNDVGSFFNRSNSQFFEKIPSIPSNDVFIQASFGYKDMSRVQRGASTAASCLINEEDLDPSISLADHCTSIPRCLGYVEDFCLVTTAVRDDPLLPSARRYFEKIKRHKVFDKLSSSGFGTLLVPVSCVILFVFLTAFPKYHSILTLKVFIGQQTRWSKADVVADPSRITKPNF